MNEEMDENAQKAAVRPLVKSLPQVRPDHRRQAAYSFNDNHAIPITARMPSPKRTAFQRRELSEILQTYSFFVTIGEWRDYAIDYTDDRAIFSIFGHAGHVPLYRIEKSLRYAKRRGAFAVFGACGTELKRSQELMHILYFFRKKLSLRKSKHHLRCV